MLGIIPAAGNGSRWGGFQKMLLPIHDSWLINKVIETMRFAGADKILVVANSQTLPLLSNHLKNEDVFYAIQQKNQDIWGAIQESFPIADEVNLFAMPDTVFDADIFTKMEGDFCLGVHETDTPERFGVLLDGRVVNKKKMKGSYPAWGTLMWSRDVVDFWQAYPIRDYTTAINMAMTTFGYSTAKMKNYYDMASWEDYHDLVQR